ncbi:uncharacterized protein LOC132726246 [Ruditapes philippinarum]|uniref:uncharacterized protein LOC132726246 n=1 Tax=Ruditapes philippinarum TaxID=129788 RepID=UPI00295C1FD4|nr:uncharacterized protein LOC132726246 [Ruditapes philippinarum]
MKLQRSMAIVRIAFLLVISIAIVNAAVANRLDEDLFNDKNDGSITLKSADSSFDYKVDHQMYTIPLRHFARHGLCRNKRDKQYFYKALKGKLCQIKEMFVATFVEDLCKHRGSFLDKWVSELFDVDGDGMITHHEKRLYKINN